MAAHHLGVALLVILGRHRRTCGLEARRTGQDVEACTRAEPATHAQDVKGHREGSLVYTRTLSFIEGFADHVRSRLGARGSGAVQGGAMRCTECQAFCCEAVGIDKWRHWVAAALVVETTVATAAAIGARGLRP
eukprot:7388600-Prymnesium_polylepis.1